VGRGDQTQCREGKVEVWLDEVISTAITFRSDANDGKWMLVD